MSSPSCAIVLKLLVLGKANEESETECFHLIQIEGSLVKFGSTVECEPTGIKKKNTELVAD